MQRLVESRIESTQERARRRKRLQRLAATIGRKTVGDLTSLLNGTNQCVEDDPNKKPEFRLANERLYELLEILWADPRLWRRIRNSSEPKPGVDFIAQAYGLQFPVIPKAVWLELANALRARKSFFEKLISMWSIGYRPVYREDVIQELERKIPRYLAGDLLWEYIESEFPRQTFVVASQQFSPAALHVLDQVLKHIRDDVQWCLAHPGQILPELAPQGKGRPPDPQKALDVEQMVAWLFEDPTLSDGELARGFDGKSNPTRRKLASTARQLVKWRHGFDPRHYVETKDGKTIGRRPPSKNKSG